MNPKLLRWLLVLCLAVFTTSVAKNAHAAVPETIQYSGALAIEGSPMDGRADLSFKLYNSASGGSSIWSESHAGHAINGGQFGVELGSQSPLGPALDGGPLWLEVSVNGVVLSPRQQVSSAPYALRALDAETFGGHEPSDFLSASTPMTAESVIYAGRSSTPQVQGALDQLFTLLDGLQATVSDQGDMLSSLSTELASTTAELAALRIEYDLSVSENQQLSAELESMQLWSIGADSSLFDLSAAVLDMQGSLSQTSANVSNLEDATDSLSGELNSLDARVSSLESSSAGGSGEGDLGGLMSRVDDLEAQASQNEQGLADLSGSLSDYALNSDLAQMQGQLSALESTTDGLSGELSGLDARLTDVELSGGEGSSGGDFSGLISRIDGIELRVDDNEQELADIAASFDDYALSTELGQLQQQVTALDSAFGDLDDRFDGLESSYTALESGQSVLEGAQSALASQVSGLESGIQAHSGTLSDLGARVEAIELAGGGSAPDLAPVLGRLNALEGWRSDDVDPALEDLSDLPASVFDLNYGFTNLDSSVSSLEFRTGALESDYSSLVQTVSALDLGALETRVDDLEGWQESDVDPALASLDSGLTSLEGELGDLEADLLTLSDAQGGMQTQISDVEQGLSQIAGLNLESRTEQLEDWRAYTAEPALSLIGDLQDGVANLQSENLANRVSTIEDWREDSAEPALSNLQGQLYDIANEDLPYRLDNVENSLFDLSSWRYDDVGPLLDDVRYVSGDISDLQSDMMVAQLGISALESELLPSRLSDLELWRNYTADPALQGLSSLESDVADLADWRDDSSSLLADLEGLLDEELGDRLGDLELDINQLELELDNLDNSIQGQFVTLNGDISMHDAQLFNLDAALTLLQGTVSDHSSALGGLDDWAPGVDLQLSTLEGDIYTLDNDFTILDSTVTTLSNYNLNSRLSSLESWRTDDIDTFIDDAGDDIADLLTRTQYQRAELVGGLPGLVFEGTNLYVRSGSPEYLGGHTCRGEEPPTQMAPIADPSRQKSRPACDDDPKEGIYCDGTMDMMNCHIENMEGAGLGNLIIGYGKPTMDDSFESGGMDPDSGAIKLGMHNLVIGLGHNWAGTYNILHGVDHYVEQDYAAVIGGQYNYVLSYTQQPGPFFPMGAVMVGGFGNLVDASMTTLLGGYGDLITDPGWGVAEIGDPEAFYEP